MPESSQNSFVPPPPIVALVGWVVPGAGYFLIGQRLRGLVIGVTILLLFAGGLLIGGIRVIEAPTGFSLPLILQKPWFIGQVFAGPVTPICNYIANHWDGGAPWSHARVYEIGTLYTAVAGMLNLMAIIDAAYRASHEGAR
jgi:hypothetical protein